MNHHTKSDIDTTILTLHNKRIKKAKIIMLKMDILKILVIINNYRLPIC